ncbi:Uncharacterised protein at_DN1661 [Pycnogonum litorale]
MANFDVEYHSKFGGYSHEEACMDAIIPKMNWNKNATENAIDIGCAAGIVSSKVLWPKLERYGVKHLTCIDINPAMISKAKSNYDHPAITYHEADIGNIDSIPSEWIGKFDKAFSFYVFQLVPSFREAIGNVHKLLKQSGEIAFLFVKRTPLRSVQTAMLQKEKWKTFLKAGDVTMACVNEIYQNEDMESSVRAVLEQCGFETKSSSEVNLDKYFENAEDFRNFLLAIDPEKMKIPDDMLEEYTSDLYDEYVKASLLENGNIVKPAEGSHVHYERSIFLHAVKILTSLSIIPCKE